MGIRLDITDDMAKADEIKILEKLEDSFKQNPDNYLAALFTAPFTFWASQRIKDDILVDVMEYINHDQTEETRCLRKEVDLQKSNCRAITALYDKNQEELEGFRRRYLELSQDKTNWLEDNDKLQNSLSDANDKIIELKARLYDLLNK